jgi:hypothetical protein
LAELTELLDVTDLLKRLESIEWLEWMGYINPGFWIGDSGLPIPEFVRLPVIESVALFPRIDITDNRWG